MDAVFVGRVVGIQSAADAPKFGTRRVEIAVVEAFRGVTPGQVIVRTYPANGASCGYPFAEGETYLVYGFEPEPGILVATMCGRTRVASEVIDEIAYLRSLARPVAGTTARVKGQLQTLAWPPPAHAPTDAFPRVRLTATGTSGTFTTTSNTKGEFNLEGLPLGRYDLKVETPDRFEGETRAVDLLHGDSCRVTYVTIWHSGRVSGRVVGRDGAPIANLSLELLRTEPASVADADAFLAARTADDGTFEFRRVPPGDFSLRVARGKAFYPGVTTKADAGRISVGAGQHVRVTDFTLPSPVETVTIEGVALTAGGKPAAGAAVSVRPAGQPEGALPLTTGADGSFKVTVLAGANYTIHATRSLFQGKRLVSVEAGEMALRAATAAQSVRIVMKER